MNWKNKKSAAQAEDTAPASQDLATESEATEGEALTQEASALAPAPKLEFELCRFNKRNGSPAGRAHKLADLLRGFGYAVMFADPDESGEVVVTASR
jgi:hypothetical protein